MLIYSQWLVLILKACVMPPPLAENVESPLEHSKDAQGDSPATEANKLYFGFKAAKLKLDLALDTSY